MSLFITTDSFQNIYDTDKNFKLISKQEVFLLDRKMVKLTYRDDHHLIWKIAQVAIAVLLTLATLGLVFLFKKNIIWRKTTEHFKYQTVFQLDVPKFTQQPQIQSPIPLLTYPLQTPSTTSSLTSIITQVATPSIPLTTPAGLSSVPPPTSAIVTTSPPCKFQMQKDKILKDNPEYSDAVQDWDIQGISINDQIKRLEKLRAYAFGTDQWNNLTLCDITGETPKLPKNIYEILFTDKKDSHLLVLIPEAVMINGIRQNLSLSTLKEIIPPLLDIKYNFLDKLNSVVTKSHWAFIKRNLYCINMKHKEQLKGVEKIHDKDFGQYYLPSAIEIAVCSIMNMLKNELQVFEEGLRMRCEEQFNKMPVVVDFFKKALEIRYEVDKECYCCGVCPVARFF